jgi:hypothetical protein
MCDGIELYSGELGAQYESVEELNFRGSVDYDETRKRLQL